VIITAGEEAFRRPQKMSSNRSHDKMCVRMMMMIMMLRIGNFRNLKKNARNTAKI
jgi:hypothetical protein